MSNLPWFTDLIFQVPMQYCSLQHQSWLLPPDTSTTECQFFFGRATPFFLEILFIAFSFPSTILDTFWCGGLIFISFCLVKLSIRFSRQEYWNGLLFPSPVDYVLSELITITGPSWVALHDMTHSFTEYTSPFHDKAVIHKGEITRRWIHFLQLSKNA